MMDLVEMSLDLEFADFDILDNHSEFIAAIFCLFKYPMSQFI